MKSLIRLIPAKEQEVLSTLVTVAQQMHMSVLALHFHSYYGAQCKW